MILRETQDQNDADDANDAESGIWYRDILKTVSSTSLSSRKNSAGVWGTPQKCACGWPHAMLAKHVYPKTMTNKPDTHTNPYFPRVNRPLIHWKYLTRRSESMIDSLCPQKRNVAKIQPIAPEWISLDSFKNLDSKKWISSDSRCN